MKIKLQGQPAEILVMLLERPGETVTREELQKKLWAADTFVDFEQGLNNAMNRLRVALDDDAESLATAAGLVARRAIGCLRPRPPWGTHDLYRSRSRWHAQRALLRGERF